MAKATSSRFSVLLNRFSRKETAGEIKSGVRLVSAQSVVGILDQGVIALTAVIPIVLLGRLAGANDLGLYSLATAAVLFLTIICQTLLLSGYPIFHARDRGSSKVYLFYVVIYGLLLQALLFPLLLAGLARFPQLDSGEATPHAVLAIYIITAVARSYLRTASLNRQDLFAVLILDTLSLVASAALFAWLVLHGSADVWGVCFSLVFVNGLFGVAWLWLYRQEITPEIAGALPYLVRSIAFGRWAFLGVACGSMAYYGTPWLLALLRGTEETAVFASAMTVVGIVNQAFLGLTKGIEGRTADSYHRGGVAELRASLKHTYWVVLPALSALLVVVFLAANLLGALVLPSQADRVAAVARILCLSLLPGSVRIISGNGLWAMNLPQETFPADLVRGVASIGFAVPGAYYAGALGVAVAVVIGDLASSAILVRRYRAITSADVSR